MLCGLLLHPGQHFVKEKNGRGRAGERGHFICRWRLEESKVLRAGRAPSLGAIYGKAIQPPPSAQRVAPYHL